MRMNLSNRDWEILSAYMDGQLSSGKRAQLEARMQANPELRAALDELAQTRAMLRSLPRLKAPRSFRLTPEMVGQKQPRRMYPYFQFASAISSLLLVLVLLGDFLGIGLQAGLPQMSSQAPDVSLTTEVMLESAPESLVMEMPVEEPASVMKAATNEEGQLEDTELFQEERVAGAVPAEPDAEAEAYPVVPPAPGEAAPALMMEAAEAPSEATVAADMPAPVPQVAEPEMDQPDPSAREGYSSLRILQISLALLTLVTGLLAVYLRRIGG